MIDGKDFQFNSAKKMLILEAGTRLSNISKISTLRICERSSRLNASDTSKIPVFIVACSSFSLPGMRKHRTNLYGQVESDMFYSLKPIDIVVLKKLSDVVNVVPVIAKSDSLTLDERMAFKERIKEEFAFHNLKMYPYDNDELDEEEREWNAEIKVGYDLLLAWYTI